MKREVLFEAVRDEGGHLFLRITDTRINIRMHPRFWRNLIKSFQRYRARGEYFYAEDLGRSDQVIEMIKAALEKRPTKR